MTGKTQLSKHPGQHIFKLTNMSKKCFGTNTPEDTGQEGLDQMASGPPRYLHWIMTRTGCAHTLSTSCHFHAFMLHVTEKLIAYMWTQRFGKTLRNANNQELVTERPRVKHTHPPFAHFSPRI